MTQDTQPLKHIVEAALLAAGRPMNLDELLALFTDEERPERTELRAALEALRKEYTGRGIELSEVANGFRIQIKQSLSPWVSRLWEERPARYSRALLETLALIAYRQPITRGEIEDVRGVTVSTHIMKTLQDRNWIRMVGHRDVPGHPAMFATTREFLDYFSLRSLDELPTLAALKDIDSLNVELDLGDDNPLRQVVDDSDAGAQGDDDNGASLHADGETGEPVVEPPQS
ncbi:MAG: SMC-Scp complex subunit ScpB [Gammaproteobacteria bacterium]